MNSTDLQERPSFTECFFVAEVVLTLLAIETALRWWGFSHCYDWLKRWPSPIRLRVGQPQRAQRIAHIVTWTNEQCLPLSTTCLTRSLVLFWVLRRHRLPAELRLGVRRATETFEAHAWVEVDGMVLAETDDVLQLYETFDLAG